MSAPARPRPGKRRGSCARLAGLALAAALVPTLAVAADARTTAQLLQSWDFSPDISIPTFLALAIYAAGVLKRPGSFEATPWRHAAFFWGVMGTFLSLASPLDALSDHLFSVHQVQHMLIRVVGPMLIALSQPQAALIAGLPGPLKRGAVGPTVGFGVIRAIFGFLTQPVAATAIFIASLYVWELPRLQNLAILNEGVHYVMHISMLAAGLLFFWRVFDQRPAPKGARYSTRLMMLWVSVLANIPIGALTTFKHQELYTAYDVVGRLFNIAPMDDERLGGFIMWAPGSMMMLLAVLVVIHAWGGHEEKQEERRQRAIARAAVAAVPVPSPVVAQSAADKNRAVALGLGAFAAFMLASALTIGFLVVYARGDVSTALAPGAAVVAAQHAQASADLR